MELFSNSDDNDRGQVGIGTLIIFIAMVLVAAVAAGVLINTAGLLQSRAEDMGADAQAQVSNQIDVVSATGAVNDTSPGVDTVTFLVKKSPGSDPIDLSQATIQCVSDTSDATLVYHDGLAANGTHYVVLDSSNTNVSDTVLDQSSERLKIQIAANAIEGATLAEGETATLRVIDQSGATTTYGVNVPDTLGSKDYVLV
ncbi:archaellin/type IV pilin N-terminal domain-containing protein [Haladaptatus sp. DYSN1]|uniref:archaellin/type IV pilin N-terminal domain-containing protein n=1 Tax=unclassified Haladaptatus TaxID=2622732 RepID=UPI002405CAFA|nr:archaellin/type IV pilin N-terminal domain-containing protein [Haladaptatus sp. DYSN1]